MESHKSHQRERRRRYRNWGRDFPKLWAWLVSNNFINSPGTSFVAGGGQPKVLDIGYPFSGVCIGLNHNGKDYIFRTTDLDKIWFNIGWGIWDIVGENYENQRIEISAFAPPDQFMLLPFQTPKGPIFYDYEALTGKMSVKLYERESKFDPWTLIADLKTENAGIEWGTPDPLEFDKMFLSTMQLQ